jgi:3-oxoacyl-[acyl-carrier-protein] synthase-1
MESTAYVVSNGARTALGLRAASSAAAVHAAVSSAREHPFFVDQAGDPLIAAFDWRLDARVRGPDRLLALAESALQEACAPLRDVSRSLRLPVYLALPELRPGFDRSDVETVRRGLAGLVDLPIHSTEVRAIPAGNAAGFAAFASAADTIERGEVQAALVGGVDSYLHSETLGWLDADLRIASAVSRSGFVPGEGAGFCLLANRTLCQRLGLPPLARVVTTHTGMEEKSMQTEAVCVGEGLAKTIQNACGDLADLGPIDDVICDINGERYRSQEWGFVCLHLPRQISNPTAYLCPANCWGDVGAASAPLFAMLACHAAAYGFAAGSRSLLWAGSDGGLRGAAVLDTSPSSRTRD